MWHCPRRHKIEINKKEKNNHPRPLNNQNIKKNIIKLQRWSSAESASSGVPTVSDTTNCASRAACMHTRLQRCFEFQPSIIANLKCGSWTNVDSQWNSVYKAFHRIFCCGNEQMCQCDLDAANLNLRPALEHGYGQQTPSASIIFSRATLL